MSHADRKYLRTGNCAKIAYSYFGISPYYSLASVKLKPPFKLSLARHFMQQRNTSQKNQMRWSWLRLKRTLSSLCCTCFVFIVSSAAISEASTTDEQQTPASIPTLLVLGDSLSASYGFDPTLGWVTLLEAWLQDQSIPVSVVNISISGETTSGGLQRLPAALARGHPELVVIALGGNDGLRGTSLTVIGNNLESMIKLSQEHGANTLLAGMRIPPNYGPRYTQGFFEIYARLSSQYGSALVPFLLDGIATEPKLMQSDGLHPTSDAQTLILDNVKPALGALLPL